MQVLPITDDQLFLPTPSARRATGNPLSGYKTSRFLPTPSARRATGYGNFGGGFGGAFLPTPSARRATANVP